MYIEEGNLIFAVYLGLYMKKVYIYPVQNDETKLNPYLSLMQEAFEDCGYDVVSSRSKYVWSTLDLFRALGCELVVLNWPENIGHKKMSFVHLFLIVLWLFLSRVFGAKVVWVLHNKATHRGDNFVCRVARYVTAKLTSFTCTHAKEGLRYFEDRYQKKNIFYFPHPVYGKFVNVDQENCIYDYVVWGNISRYKGVLEFLNFVAQDKYLYSKKILICGFCFDVAYSEEIDELVKRLPNVTFRNKFIDNEGLDCIVKKCRYVLFLYKNESVLSSGGLVYSLKFGKPILGPNGGAFRDLAEFGCANIYRDFGSIELVSRNFHYCSRDVSLYYRKYTWENFISSIIKYNYND